MSAGTATTASPFAILLRRSRFASYDPYIRQTYTAPPDHASRGSWGLKRALPLRRRDAFITVPNAFDSPNYFVDWSNAENQVRFIRRFEEMDTFPALHPTSPWAKYIDTKNATGWLIDSEFTERDEGPEIEEVDLAKKEEEKAKITGIESEAANVEVETVHSEVGGDSSFRIDLPTLGQSGKGAYGAHRPVTPIGNMSTVSPNIYAMSNKEFEHYLKKLRKLRPEFQKHMAHVAEKNEPDGTPHSVRGKSLYELAQNANNTRHHHFFLASHTSAELKTPESRLIEPRPHLNGGLMYAWLPELYSHFYAKKENGIVLQSRKNELRSKKAEKRPVYQTEDPSRQYIVSFGGMTSVVDNEAELTSKNRSPNTVSLFSYKDVQESSTTVPSPFTRPPSEGVGVGASIIPMRLKSAKLESPPIVVGHRRQGLKAVRLATTVTTSSHSELQRTSNPHKPGTWEYMAMGLPQTQKYVPLKQSAGEFRPSLRVKDEPPKMNKTQNEELILSLRSMASS